MDIDINKVIPVGRHVLVRRCIRQDVEKDGVTIYIPDVVKDDTNFCEILRVGSKCKTLSGADEGSIVHVPDALGSFDHRACLDDKGTCYLVPEDDIVPVVYDDNKRTGT